MSQQRFVRIPATSLLVFLLGGTAMGIENPAFTRDLKPVQTPADLSKAVPPGHDAETVPKAPTNGVPEGPAQRLRREGIRAMHNADLDRADIADFTERMATAGFNLVLPWHPVNSPLQDARKTTPPDSPVILRPEDVAEESVARLRDWASTCKSNGILLMYTLYVASANEVRILTGLEAKPDGHLLNYVNFESRDLLNSRVRKLWPAHHYRQVVDWEGLEQEWAPCPLERRYWMGLIRPELELVARVLKETGTGGGAALELETYCFYSIYPGMASQKKAFCYCDECFYGFARSRSETDVPDAIPPNQRLNWLTQRGLLPAYEQSLEDRLAAIVRELMRDVRKINPPFLFGFYPYAPHWYYDALIRGSGTPELPCLLFSSAEYSSGYRERTDPPYTFFSEVSTSDGIAHLRDRGLHALYAGGLYDRGIGSPEAYALAADRLLRAANGYWAYHELPKADFEPFWKYLPAVNRWNRAHPGALPAGSLRSVLPGALRRIAGQNQPGLAVEQGRIVARYQADDSETPVISQPLDAEQELERESQGRNPLLPSLDQDIVHSGKASLRFEPSAARKSPQLPYMDYVMPGAKQPCEMSFWVKTEAPAAMRLNVGAAQNDQHPAYMWYHNFVLPARQDWTRLRIAPLIFVGIERLDVVRFWCQATSGKLWIDDIEVRPVQERRIDVPLELPGDASDWGAVMWRLAPLDAYVEAELIAAQDDRVLQKRIYSGDSLAPLMAVVGREPVRLRLRVYPSAQDLVALEDVQLGSVQQNGPAK